jgi:hypothetical protein
LAFAHSAAFVAAKPAFLISMSLKFGLIVFWIFKYLT